MLAIEARHAAWARTFVDGRLPAEQAEVRGSRIGPRTDIWALGLIAFYALTGRIYWLTAKDPKVQVAMLLRELLMAPLAPASVRAKELGVEDPLPPGFDAWFARCVTREPIDRFESVALLEAELCELLGLDASMVKYIGMGHERGLGHGDEAAGGHQPGNSEQGGNVAGGPESSHERPPQRE